MSDPMMLRAAVRDKAHADGGGCVFAWPNRNAKEDPDHPEHHCRWLQGHYRDRHPHRCPCGATKAEKG